MKKSKKLYKRRRAAIIIALTILLSILIYSTTAYGFRDIKYQNITVHSGDNLWNIAQKYYSDGDIRENVYQIKKANNLKDSCIYTGQELKIPEVQ